MSVGKKTIPEFQLRRSDIFYLHAAPTELEEYKIASSAAATNIPLLRSLTEYARQLAELIESVE